MGTLIKINQLIHQALTNNHLDLGNQFDNKYLTKRETEVLRYVVLGYTAKQIGQILNISHRTVEAYIDNLKSKLNCNSKSEIISVVLTSDIFNKLHIM